jgi:excisionase family DNA binding protein
MEPDDLLHDLQGTGRRLGGIGRTTVYGLIGAGELKAIKIGRRTLVPESEIRAYIDRSLAAVGGDTHHDEPAA